MCFERVGVEGGDPPGAIDDVDEPLPMRQVRPQYQMVVAPWRQLEDAWVAVDHDRPAVGAAVHVLHAGDRPPAEVAQHGVPVEEPLEREPQRQPAVGHQPVRRPTTRPQLARRGAEGLTARPVELAEAPEARSEGDLGDREIGVVEEPSGEMGTEGSSQGIGRDAQAGREQPVEVTARHPQTGSEMRLRRAVEGAADDEVDSPADQVGPARRDRVGGTVRAATPARPVPRRLGRCGEVEPSHVLGQRPAPAPRPAVDARGDDG